MYIVDKACMAVRRLGQDRYSMWFYVGMQSEQEQILAQLENLGLMKKIKLLNKDTFIEHTLILDIYDSIQIGIVGSNYVSVTGPKASSFSAFQIRRSSRLAEGRPGPSPLPRVAVRRGQKGGLRVLPLTAHRLLPQL